jgi:hypothetical protein
MAGQLSNFAPSYAHCRSRPRAACWQPRLDNYSAAFMQLMVLFLAQVLRQLARFRWWRHVVLLKSSTRHWR